MISSLVVFELGAAIIAGIPHDPADRAAGPRVVMRRLSGLPGGTGHELVLLILGIVVFCGRASSPRADPSGGPSGRSAI